MLLSPPPESWDYRCAPSSSCYATLRVEPCAWCMPGKHPAPPHQPHLFPGTLCFMKTELTTWAASTPGSHSAWFLYLSGLWNYCTVFLFCSFTVSLKIRQLVFRNCCSHSDSLSLSLIPHIFKWFLKSTYQFMLERRYIKVHQQYYRCT